MPVHLTGRIGEFDEIKAIADKYNISIIEDQAQAIDSFTKTNMLVLLAI